MAEGYTVAEAAELLGIPQRRVLQLIERGVLHGGLDERRRWRVHLVAPSEAVPTPDSRRDRSRGPASGDRDDGPGEAAPGEHAVSDESRSNFRDLLAELRHLQERYGQALLALGEARGETAALRERLGHLESGRDVRLGAPVSPPVSPPVTPATPHAAEPPPADDRADAPEAAPRAGRFRTAGVTDAMARAKDPAPFELPGAREAAVALAALRRPAASGRPPPPAPVPPVSRPATRHAPAAVREAVEIHDLEDIRAAVGLRGGPGARLDPAPDPSRDRPLDRLRRWLAG